MGKELKELTRVNAPYWDGQIKPGTVVDVLSSQYFIAFDDGTEAFVFKSDMGIKLREKEE